MSRTDLVADALTMLRNATRSGKEKVDVPSSSLLTEMMRVLKREGYIANYRTLEEDKHGLVRVYLRYLRNKKPVITQIKRISKPGLRQYVKYADIPRVLSGLGIAILTTSKGIMTDKDAKAAKVGGELLCYVW